MIASPRNCRGSLSLITAILLAIGAAAQSAETPSLKDAFKGHFYVGSAINRSITMGFGFRRRQEQVLRDIALAKAQFNQITPENEMKWGSIHPRPGSDGYDWAPADAFVEFGAKNNLYLVGHTLVWHAQTPNWVFQGAAAPAPGEAPKTQPPAVEPRARDEGPGEVRPNSPRRGGFGPGFERLFTGPKATREELLQRMHDHIGAVVGRYKGKVKVWDVVNEALSDFGPDTLRKSLWLDIIGPDFIEKAFEYAHEADPDAILRYNDYGLENPEKRRKLISLIKSLQEKKVPVMAIGTQAHVNVSTSFEAMDQSLTELETLGLPIHVTELDVNSAAGGQRSTAADISGNSSTTQGGLVSEADQKLAAAYAGLFRAFLKHDKSVAVVTFWGLNDALSWRSQGKPLLFDGDNKPKPAFDAVIRVATETPEKTAR